MKIPPLSPNTQPAPAPPPFDNTRPPAQQDAQHLSQWLESLPDILLQGTSEEF